jgi:serine/threonine protein phosphatase Stp1
MPFSEDNPRFVSYALTHAGLVRPRNEDAYLAQPGLWAVADGMGGHQAGNYASARTVAALAALEPPSDSNSLVAEVESRLTAVDTELRDRAAVLGHDTVIASTVVALVATDEGFTCIWAGDSRAYLWRDGGFRQLTIDHSRAQELLSAGLLRPEAVPGHPEAHVVTQAIGGGRLAFGKVTGDVLPGDRFLLCSDGLTNMLADFEIASELAAAPLKTAAQRLLDGVLARGAVDNVTIVVVATADTPEPHFC